MGNCRKTKLTVGKIMKTKYNGHEITVLKNGNAILNGITYNNLAIAIMEINWIYGIGNPDVTMQTRVGDL
ncbi:hypothetical protein GC1_00032 [Gluconobacter phage GC1]|uniref:Uncharacterized protein n=1 Tax=Gluconobacter phage GC1 TaxID=2047788 RepID=A0A2I5AR91_9VIRU|nr:hypothetical protein FDJ08_gp32 [Gluconobacter phage GC1]ATS92600.1 hypothetical protein GC1_00032 [Gluconobacter phage GC1]